MRTTATPQEGLRGLTLDRLIVTVLFEQVEFRAAVLTGCRLHVLADYLNPVLFLAGRTLKSNPHSPASLLGCSGDESRTACQVRKEKAEG